MTAVELASLCQLKEKKRLATFRAFSIDELESIKRQAMDAYRVVGESARFNPISEWTGNSYNTLELTAKLAERWIDIKQGR